MPDEPVSNTQKIASNKPTIHSTGDKVGGDKITVGNISDIYTAIGAGAQVIVNQVQQALSSVDELEKSIQAAERRLAESIQRKILSYTHLTAADSSARLWDFDGNQLALLPHDDWVSSASFHPTRSASFHPTENLILTRSDDNSARLWRYFPTLDEMLLQAERDMHIELTQAECETYFAEFDPAFCKNWDEK